MFPADSPEALIASALQRDASALSRAEWRAELVAGTLFVLAAGLAWWLLPWDREFRWLNVLVAFGGLVLASQVRFAVPSGYTVPIALVFVPVLFLVPLPMVPALTALALVAGLVPGIARGTVRASRLATAPANAFFALGPAVVLALWGDLRPADTAWWALMAAMAAQIACDLLGSSLREFLVRGATLAEQLGEAAWVYGVDVALSAAGLVAAYAVSDHPLHLLLLLPMVLLMHVFASERRRRLEQLGELNTAYRGTAMVLGDMVEADDAYTGQHSREVLELSLAVADALGLDHHARRNVEFGALLHDVGKVAIPKSIIRKEGPLDEHEWAIVRTHTVEGQQLLDRMGGVMSAIGKVVRSSHERWDGRGYPDGLAERDIPLESRIISACDTFSAMTTTRSYRRALSHEEAVAELRGCAGSQLDPDVVRALVVLVDTAATVPGGARLAS
ncbi:MAG: HD domain-containing protein [Thermoleophilia bacterium]|nr:HD domain-containing protein [Thermoleophilia bacterium]